jgi:hypothetical protein
MIRKLFLVTVCAIALAACSHKSAAPAGESCACGKKAVKEACSCHGCSHGDAGSCTCGSGSCAGEV